MLTLILYNLIILSVALIFLRLERSRAGLLMDDENAGRPAWLLALSPEDTQFLKRFLLSSGSLKDLAAEYEVSYPTIRSRLDRLIAKVQAVEDPRINDPFVRKMQVLVADGVLPQSVARELLDAHRESKRGRS
jgi:hypothetical protein